MSEELDNINEEEINMLMKLLDDIDIDESQDIDYNAIMDSFGIDIDELEKEMEDYIPKIEMGFVKSKEGAVPPSYNYVSDSGFDLYSIEESWIHPFDRSLINTGLILDIPEGYDELTISLDGGWGDANLFVRHKRSPTLFRSDCASISRGNAENCTFTNPKSGKWKVRVNGFLPFGNVKLTYKATKYAD